jgi:hypothetical protein
MDVTTAALIAVHVVEIAKTNDTYCGGPTRLGLLRVNQVEFKPNEPIHDALSLFGNWYTHDPGEPTVRPELIDKIVEIVKQTEANIKKHRGEFVRDKLRTLSFDILRGVIEETKRDSSPRQPQ